MSANSSLDLVSLDFDTTKQNLKNFLKSQAVFKDFDFEGSNISVLLDVLSYNTFMNGFYLNMVASESFLDSAQLKDSVISHAKELNYLPRSNKSAQVTLEPYVVSLKSDATSLVIPKGTRFSGISKGVSYNFVTASNYINNTPKANNTANTAEFYVSSRENDSLGASYIVNPFIIYQGNYQTDTFVADYSIENQRFILSDTTIDTDSIVVTVIENSGATIYNYTYATTLLNINNTDAKFFLQSSDNGKYEIIFGDDIIGRKPKNGSVIKVEYRTTDGDLGNGISIFSLDTNIGATSGSEIRGNIPTILASSDLVSGSYGGSIAESIEQIRYKAPRYFQTQERAITPGDYEILLQNQFPEIGAIAVFGGETFDPPLFGKVYISVKLKDIDGLPDAKKNEYAQFIKPRSPLSIDAVFITPENLYVKVVSSVNYNINVTSARPDQIKNQVSTVIQNFDSTYLQNFNVTLRKSRLLNAIDNADQSIISNDTNLTVFKKFIPFLGISQNWVIRIGVPLLSTIPTLSQFHNKDRLHAVSSSKFVYGGETCILEDNGDGIINIVTFSGTNHKFKISIGTVEYSTGTIKLNDFNIDSFEGQAIKIFGLPAYGDIEGMGNNILELALEELNITVNTVRL